MTSLHGPAPEARELEMNWMDRAIVAQTYPGRPMTTHHVVDADAPFDRALLARALAALIASVPTLRSYVRESPISLARVAVPAGSRDAAHLLTWSDAAIDLNDADWFGRTLDLATTAPVRLLHAPRTGGGYQLVFTLHHSVTDGVGALALFDALLAHYCLLDGEPVVIPDPVAPSGARLRRLLTRRGLRFTASLLRANVVGARRFGERRAALLERIEARGDALHCAVVDVDAAVWSQLRERATRLGATRNDLLLAALLRAATAWRRERGVPDETFRALVPVDLRGEFGVGRSLQNHIGVIEADFTATEVDRDDLPQQIADRLRAGREPGRALGTPMALALLGAVLPPFAVRAFFRWLDERPSSFMYSFLFSHIRVPEGIRLPASVRARRVYCLSGLPRQPGVGLTVTALPGSVTAALAYEVPRLSDDGASELMRRFLAALEET